MKMSKIVMFGFLLCSPLVNGAAGGEENIFDLIDNHQTEKAIKLIIANPMVLTQTDKRGNTPLYIAALGIENEELIKFMLSNPLVKQFINITNNQGTSPLCSAAGGLNFWQNMLARRPNNEEAKRQITFLRNVILALLDAGADDNICNRDVEKERINEVKMQTKAVTQHAVQRTVGGGSGPHSIIYQYMVEQTPAERAEDEKWEAQRIKEAAERVRAQATSTEKTEPAAKSLDDVE